MDRPIIRLKTAKNQPTRPIINLRYIRLWADCCTTHNTMSARVGTHSRSALIPTVWGSRKINIRRNSHSVGIHRTGDMIMERISRRITEALALAALLLSIVASPTQAAMGTTVHVTAHGSWAIYTEFGEEWMTGHGSHTVRVPGQYAVFLTLKDGHPTGMREINSDGTSMHFDALENEYNPQPGFWNAGEHGLVGDDYYVFPTRTVVIVKRG